MMNELSIILEESTEEVEQECVSLLREGYKADRDFLQNAEQCICLPERIEPEKAIALKILEAKKLIIARDANNRPIYSVSRI